METDGGEILLDAYLDVFKQDRVNENSPADTDGPASDTKTVALCSHSAREDFCGDQEGNCAPGGCVDEVEEEKHGDGGRSDASCLGRVVAGGFVQGGSLFDKSQSRSRKKLGRKEHLQSGLQQTDQQRRTSNTCVCQFCRRFEQR